VTDQDRPVQAPEAELVPTADHEITEEERQYSGARDASDREWTHDPLERSFFSTVGRGYVIGIIVFGLFAFLLARTQAPEWGTGAAIGAAVFVAFFAGVLGGVVLIGLWAMKNEELIRGNETGDSHAPGWVVDTSHEDEPTPHAAEAPAAETETEVPAAGAEAPAGEAEAEAPAGETEAGTEAIDAPGDETPAASEPASGAPGAT
jgi:predicted cobalt transporter CbtA